MSSETFASWQTGVSEIFAKWESALSSYGVSSEMLASWQAGFSEITSSWETLLSSYSLSSETALKLGDGLRIVQRQLIFFWIRAIIELESLQLERLGVWLC